MSSTRTETRLAEALGAFALASDYAFGIAFEDSARSCYMATRIAQELGFRREDQQVVYYTALLKDAGCTCWTSPLASLWMTDEIAARRELLIFGDPTNSRFFFSWMWEHVGQDMPLYQRTPQLARVFRQHGPLMREGFEAACEISVRLGNRIGLHFAVQEAVGYLFESWDGSGMPRGVSGDAIPAAARVVYPTFFLAPLYSRDGRQAAIDLAVQKGGHAFDPDVADAFVSLAQDEAFWSPLEDASPWSAAMAIEPGPAAYLDDPGLEGIAEAMADFADLKSPHTAAHSRRVADLAERLARQLGQGESGAREVRLAALVHDVGLVGVPSYALNKPGGTRTRAEEERMSLHPFHGERVLAQVPGLEDITSAVAAHHERWDGQGYFRRLQGTQIPPMARLIAIADRFDELTHEQPGASPLSPEDAVAVIQAESGAFAPEAVSALQAEVLGTRVRGPERDSWPAGLTDREVEVLRLVAKGLSRKEIAAELTVSQHTIRHHLEHIYTKTDTSTRVAATLFAMEEGLLP